MEMASPVVKNLTGHGVFDLMYSFFWCTEYYEKRLRVSMNHL